MDEVQLPPGIYTNIFPVALPEEPVTVMAIERAKAVDLRPLINEIRASGVPVQVYAHQDRVYGYGQDAASFLSTKGFQATQIHLPSLPALGAHLVIDGIVSLALARGFWQRRRLSPHSVVGRTEIFRQQLAGVVARGNVRVFAGYDLRCTYHAAVERLGLIVDVVWAYQDKNGDPLNTRQMSERNALTEALVVQEEFLRGTNRINQQISQIRMHRYLLPFAQEFQNVPLPCGGEARIAPLPFPVLL
ncbi:hypothetical protein [Caldilinea sp.]|jgi:hypothetical protein|uniref:hypothetical protein n=1 Tax=Caldilinea sp. TaxID=2293560 RepID=UPI00261AB33A|nr:hypothetical protein [uncultured Caldilinea sp.]